MKTVRFRFSRVIVALIFSCLCVVMVLKSAVDRREAKPAARTPLEVQFAHHPPPLQPQPDDRHSAGDSVAGAKNAGDIKRWNEPREQEDRNRNLNIAPKLSNKVNGGGGGGDLVDYNSPNKNKRLVDAQNNDMGNNNHGAAQRRDGGNGQAADTGVANLRGPDYPTITQGRFIPQARIVHFDLKGAAPKVSYFEQIFPLIAKLGGTGVLLEYEDMFPYTGKLGTAVAKNHYSVDDIKTILKAAKDSNLEVIPLVQTFGHLEWFLKLDQFKHLREVDRYAQVICISNPEAVELVKDMVDQVLKLHPDTKSFNMGMDEAFQIGMCNRCQQAIRDLGGNRERLMLKHIVAIGSHLKEKHGKRVLMWHDMLNNVDPSLMLQYKLGDYVEPVVWAYAENLNDYLMPDMWMRFAQVFPHIWGASSYKGADGPSRYYSNVPHYLQNHISWTQQMTSYYKNFRGEFKGLILTGWQRFDHFALLCEVLPVGIPSMAVNLQTILNGNYDRQTLKQASKILECGGTMDIDSQGVAGYCKFPGFRAYQYIQTLRLTLSTIDTQLFDDFQLRGWMSSFAMAHNYSSAWYLDQIVDKINMYYGELINLARNIRKSMDEVFFPDTADEFLLAYVDPTVKKMEDMLAKCKEISKINTFPIRPFDIKNLNSTARKVPVGSRNNLKPGGSAL